MLSVNKTFRYKQKRTASQCKWSFDSGLPHFTVDQYHCHRRTSISLCQWSTPPIDNPLNRPSPQHSNYVYLNPWALYNVLLISPFASMSRFYRISRYCVTVLFRSIAYYCVNSCSFTRAPGFLSSGFPSLIDSLELPTTVAFDS